MTKLTDEERKTVEGWRNAQPPVARKLIAIIDRLSNDSPAAVTNCSCEFVGGKIIAWCKFHGDLMNKAERDRLTERGGEASTAPDSELELRAALRNMADAYVRKVKTHITPDEIALEPWRCAEYIEAERLCKRPFKLHITKEWLESKITGDADLPCEIGPAETAQGQAGAVASKRWDEDETPEQEAEHDRKFDEAFGEALRTPPTSTAPDNATGALATAETAQGQAGAVAATASSKDWADYCDAVPGPTLNATTAQDAAEGGIAEIEKRHAVDQRLYEHAAIPSEGYSIAHEDRATLLRLYRTRPHPIETAQGQAGAVAAVTLTDDQRRIVNAAYGANQIFNQVSPNNMVADLLAIISSLTTPDAGWGVRDESRDWPEDFPGENGNYMTRCIECKRTFMGHKRRLVCKLCTGVKAAIAQPEDQGTSPTAQDAAEGEIAAPAPYYPGSYWHMSAKRLEAELRMEAGASEELDASNSSIQTMRNAADQIDYMNSALLHLRTRTPGWDRERLVWDTAVRELYRHAEIRMARGINSAERLALDNVLKLLTGNDALLSAFPAPPVWDRPKLIDWLEGWTYFSKVSPHSIESFADALIAAQPWGVTMPTREGLVTVLVDTIDVNRVQFMNHHEEIADAILALLAPSAGRTE